MKSRIVCCRSVSMRLYTVHVFGESSAAFVVRLPPALPAEGRKTRAKAQRRHSNLWHNSWPPNTLIDGTTAEDRMKPDRGIALILALLVLSFLTITGCALLTTAAIDLWISDNYKSATQNLYLAEAGI